MAPKLTFGVEFLTANAKQKLDSLNRSLDKTDRNAQATKRSFKDLSTGVIAGAAAFTGAVYAAAKLHRALGDLAKMGDRVEDASRAFRTLGINIETLRGATGREITDLELMEGTVNLLSRGLKLSQDQIVEYIRLMKVMSDATGESMDTLILRGARSKMMFDRLIGAAREFDTELSDTAGDAFARMETSATNLQNAFATFVTQSETLKELWSEIAGVMDDAAGFVLSKDFEDAMRLIGAALSGDPGAFLREGVRRGRERAAPRADLPPDVMPEWGQRIPGITVQGGWNVPDYEAQRAYAQRVAERRQAQAAMRVGREERAWKAAFGAKDIGLLDQADDRYSALTEKNEALKQAEMDRLGSIEDSWRQAAGLLEDAIVHAAMTGELSFRRLANSIAAMLATSGAKQLVDVGLGALFGGGGSKDISKKIPSRQFGGEVPGPIGSPQLILAHGGEEIVPAGRSKGLVVNQNINFNVNAMDSRSVAEFFEANGPHVARQLVKATDQSLALRRRLQP